MRFPKTFLFTSLVGILLLSIHYAFPQEYPNLSAMSDQEINKLDKETLKKLPALKLMKRLMKGKKGKTEKYFNLVTYFALNSLHYEANQKNLSTGIIKFQKDLKEKETGILTWGQFEEMTKRFDRVRDSRVILSALDPKIIKVSGFVSVEGTWIIEDEEIAWPINHSVIKCYKEHSTCFLVMAYVKIPKIDESGDTYNFNMHWNAYDVIKWGNNEVVSQSEGKCRITQLFLNIKSNEVLEITRNNNEKGCDKGILKIPRLKKPKISRLVNGFDVSWKFFQKRREEASKYYSSEMRDQLKQMAPLTKKNK